MDISRILLIGAVVQITLMCLAAASHKFSWLGFKPAFGLFALTLLASLLIVVVSLFFLIKGGVSSSGINTRLFLPLVLCALPVIVIVMIVGGGLRAPKIHDISTRLEPPLQFENAQSLRAKDENSLAPASAQVQALQVLHYPHVKPLQLSADGNEVFDQAISVAQAMGWSITHTDAVNLRFEAIEETRIFGFKDDILVDLDYREGLTTVDLRSVSRVGLSDLGANAARITQFLETLKNRVEPR